MTLGRTTDNKIKIKTDGGLRAVECACCGGCGCAVSLPQSIRILAANATAESFSINGLNPDDFFRESATSWTAVASLYDAYYFDGCFGFIVYSPGVAETGNPEECAFPIGSSTVAGNFTINGITGFNYFYYTDGVPVSPPIVVFT